LISSLVEESALLVNVDTRRQQRLHWAAALLILVCVVTFMALAMMSPPRRITFLLEWGTIPANVFDTHQPIWQQLRDPALIRLVTALFIHVAWLHLLSNLLFLMIFGVPAERTLGSIRFLVLFLLSGVVANFAGAISLAGEVRPIIGCSGAVSAVLGAYVTLFPRARLGLVLPLGFYLEFVRVPAFLLIGIWALLQLLFNYLGGPSYGGYAWWTHLTGFLFGVLFALMSRGAIMRRMRR
jgi:membrane associated rhomboid family serine protease